MELGILNVIEILCYFKIAIYRIFRIFIIFLEGHHQLEAAEAEPRDANPDYIELDVANMNVSRVDAELNEIVSDLKEPNQNNGVLPVTEPAVNNETEEVIAEESFRSLYNFDTNKSFIDNLVINLGMNILLIVS
jgi:hypothetical protein